MKTSKVGKVLLYSVSGGALTVLFSMLGNAEAHAAPAPNPPTTDQVHRTAQNRLRAGESRSERESLTDRQFKAAKPAPQPKVANPKPAPAKKLVKPAASTKKVTKPPVPVKAAVPAKVEQSARSRLRAGESRSERQSLTDRQFKAAKPAQLLKKVLHPAAAAKPPAPTKAVVAAKVEQSARSRLRAGESRSERESLTDRQFKAAKVERDKQTGGRNRQAANTRLRVGEARAEREALTDRVFKAQRAKSTYEAQAVAAARTVYDASQRGGAPGTAAARAKLTEQAKIAQGQVDYHDALAGRPVGERTGMVVENVAPAVSRITNPKTGEVSLNNFRLGPNAPSQQQLIPRLSDKLVNHSLQCTPDQSCVPKPTWVTYSTAASLADVCRDIDCDEDFEKEIVATLVTGGKQPPNADVDEVLRTQGMADFAARGVSNAKGPPKPLKVNER